MLEFQHSRGPTVLIGHPSFAIAGGASASMTSQRAEGTRARIEYAISASGRHLGEYVTLFEAAQNGAEEVLTERTQLRLSPALRSDLTVTQTAELSGSPALECVLPLRDGVVKMFPLGKRHHRTGYYWLGRGHPPAGALELALPLVGIGFNRFPGGTLAVATDPYSWSQFEVVAPMAHGQPSAVTTSSFYKASIVPIHEENRVEIFAFHDGAVDGLLSSFYHAIPEIQPGPEWIQKVQLNYYDYLSSYKSIPGQGWYHDVEKLAEKIPPENRAAVALCLHGYYDYVGHFCYDDRTHKLISNWNSWDKDAHTIQLSLAEVHRRIAFGKKRGFHVLLLFGDGTAADTSTPYYRKEWMIKDENGHYPSRGFWEWRPEINIKMPPSRVLPDDQFPTNQIMDPALPAVREWFEGYLRALLDEYGEELDGFVWDEAFLIERGWVSFTDPEPTYSDRAMMHLVATLSQIVQKRRLVNPNLVFLVADNAKTPYGLAAHGTWQDSACAPQMWGPGLLLNYRNSLWSCLWFPMTLDSFNRFAVEQYRLPQGVSNGWGDNVGPAEMPDQALDRIIQRFLKRVNGGQDRIRYLLTTAPPER
ncbi:MAG TPA: hypothetical protein VKV15_17130 [Bryobacteraceae bacterium]|nr:hypothetical protein [Bryobacteraceae bacterium]